MLKNIHIKSYLIGFVSPCVVILLFAFVCRPWGSKVYVDLFSGSELTIINFFGCSWRYENEGDISQWLANNRDIKAVEGYSMHIKVKDDFVKPDQSIDDRELFKTIPYYIWTAPLSDQEKKKMLQEYHLDVINNCIENKIAINHIRTKWLNKIVFK